MKVLLEQIWGDFGSFFAPGRGRAMAWVLCHPLLFSHEAGHPFPSTMPPLLLALCVDTWASIHAAMVREDFFDLFSQNGIFSAVLAGFAFAPGGKAAHRNVQRLAHHGHRILLLLLRNEMKLQSWCARRC